jgi:hypothetical protein
LFVSNREVPISRYTLWYLMQHYGQAAGLPPAKRTFHLPAGLWRHLDTIMAGRSVIIALWAVGKAKEHTRLRRDLTVWLETAVRFIAQYNQTKH